MKPAPFQYHAPRSVEEVLALLGAAGAEQEVKLLAGGQSLIPAMNFRLAKPAVLIDLQSVGGLADIESSGNTVTLGAMVTQRAAERSSLVQRHLPLLAEALPSIAHPQIRNRGTLGGSLAHADPAAELPAVMLALDARFVIQSSSGARTVPAAEFFCGLFATALEPDEILTSIEVDHALAGEGSCFREAARRSGDYALAGVAARLRVDAGGTCTLARLAFLSVDDLPVRAAAAERLLLGHVPDAERISAAAAHAAAHEIDPGSDIHASAAFRRHLAQGLAREALAVALERTRSTLETAPS